MTLADGANKFLVKIRKRDTDVGLAIGSLSHAQGQVNNLNNQALGWTVTFGTAITTWYVWHGLGRTVQLSRYCTFLPQYLVNLHSTHCDSSIASPIGR